MKALQDSFSLLVQRHQILRTIVVQEEQYWQKVQDHCDFEWEEFDFVDKHKTKQAFEEDSISIMREKAREPFNLYQGPFASSVHFPPFYRRKFIIIGSTTFCYRWMVNGNY